MEIGEDRKYFDFIKHPSSSSYSSVPYRKALEVLMMAQATVGADVHLAAAQDRVLREGNDGQGTKVTSCCLGEKGQKIIHAFRHQSRAEGFFSKCVTAERDGLSPEQGTPPDCLINFPLVLSINSLCYLFQKLENFFSYVWTSLYPH